MWAFDGKNILRSCIITLTSRMHLFPFDVISPALMGNKCRASEMIKQCPGLIIGKYNIKNEHQRPSVVPSQSSGAKKTHLHQVLSEQQQLPRAPSVGRRDYSSTCKLANQSQTGGELAKDRWAERDQELGIRFCLHV